MMQVTTCPDCNGTGSRGEPCSTCGGDGRVRRSKKISLRVPPGVDNGSRLRVKGEGNAGLRGGQGGDLYVFISVKKHSSLRREGVTIHSDIDVTYIDAILGESPNVLHCLLHMPQLSPKFRAFALLSAISMAKLIWGMSSKHCITTIPDAFCSLRCLACMVPKPSSSLHAVAIAGQSSIVTLVPQYPEVCKYHQNIAKVCPEVQQNCSAQTRLRLHPL